MPLSPEHKAAYDKFTSTDHKGKPLNQAALLKPNPMVARVLVARASALSDEDRQSLKGVVNPQTAPALKKLLPELTKLFDQGANNAG